MYSYYCTAGTAQTLPSTQRTDHPLRFKERDIKNINEAFQSDMLIQLPANGLQRVPPSLQQPPNETRQHHPPYLSLQKSLSLAVFISRHYLSQSATPALRLLQIYLWATVRSFVHTYIHASLLAIALTARAGA